MVPILLASVVALAIIIERSVVLRKTKVAPKHLVAKVWQQVKAKQMDSNRLKELRHGSSLGRILAAGLVNADADREIMKESIEDTGRHEVHRLERYLTTLGTVAAISPLLGLLGTVIGMIDVFAVITEAGVGNAGKLADGISKALITTAAGLTVAIPALIAYRYFRGKVEEIVVHMEQEALKLVEVMHGQRSADRTFNEDRG